MKKYKTIGYWIAIGAGVGTAIGTAINDIGAGIGIGIGLGVAIGSFISPGNKNDNCHKKNQKFKVTVLKCVCCFWQY